MFPGLFNYTRPGTVIALALTGQPERAGLPLTLEIHSKDLPKKSWVKISQIRTLAVERIGSRMGRATPEEMAQVATGTQTLVDTLSGEEFGHLAIVIVDDGREVRVTQTDPGVTLVGNEKKQFSSRP